MNIKRLLIMAGVLCLAAFTTFQIASHVLIPEETPKRQQIEDVFPGETKNIFENADIFTLLSLDPSGSYKGKDDFHGYRVLGKISVDTKSRQSLIDAFYTGITAEDVTEASCFFPHHGVRAEKDSNVLDLIICFQCQIVVVIPPGENRNTVHWPNISEPGTVVSDSAKPIFDNVLKKANVPLISDSVQE